MLRNEQSVQSLTALVKQRLLIHLTAFKSLLTSYPTTTTICNLIQFLFLILPLFQQNFFIYLANLTSHSAIEQNVNDIVDAFYLSNELLVTLVCVMGSILLFELGHCAMLQVEFRTQRNETWSRRLLLVIIVLYHVFAIILVPCLFSLGHKYSQTQDSKWIVIIVLIIITYWPFFITQCSICPILYDYLMLLVASILSLTSSNYKYLIVFVVSLFYAWLKTAKFQRMLYLIMVLISGWNFIDLELVVSSQGTLAQDKLVSVAICVLLVSYLVIKLASTWNHIDDQTLHLKILKLIQNSKTQILLQSNKFETVYSAWKSAVDFIQKSQNPLNNTLKQKQIKNLTKSDLIQCLMQHVRESIRSQRDINNRILYIKLKILSKSKQIEVIEGAQSLISMASRNNLSIRQQFKLVEFQNYVVQKLFGSQNDREVNTSFIIQKALDIEQYYNAVAKSLKQVIRFWQFFSRKFKSKQQITQFFDRILSAQSELRDKFRRVNEYNDINRQRRLMVQIEHILNGHIMISQWKSTQVYQLDKNLVQNCFVLIQQRKIIKCSFQFLNELGYSEDELVNGDWEIIFGERFVENLERELREVTFESRRRVIMPVFDKERNVVIKECSILIFPQMKGHVKYLISLNDVHKVTDCPIIVYSVLTDSIQFVTAHFISQFQLDFQKVLSKTSHHNLLSNELFSRIDLATQETRQLLRQQKPHNCELIVKHFAKANSKFEKLSINVSLINQFQTTNQHFYILTVKRGTFIKTQVTITEYGLGKTTLGMTHENLNPVEKYRNEKFFCLIPNSYSIKITQKLSQVADSGRRNFVFYMRMIFISALLLLSGQIIYSYFMTQQRISDLQSDQQLIYRKNNDVIEIASMYSLLFKGEYFRHYPQVVKFINADLNAAVVLQGYVRQMESTVRDFVDSHLTSLRYTTSEAGINYELKFDNFQVSTDTSKSTFIDFSQNFSQYVKTFNRTFLFANYLSFRAVQEGFSNVDIISSQLQSTFSSSLLIIYITIIIAVPLSVIGLLISVKLQFCIDQMYKLLELLEEKDSQEVLRKINNLKSKIKEIQSIFQKNQDKSRSGEFQTARILQLNQKVRQHRQSQLHGKDDIKVNARSTDKSQASQESELLSIQVTEQKQKEEQKKQPQPTIQKQKQQIKQMQNDPIVIILIRNIYALFFLIVVGFLIYIELSYRNNQIAVFGDLFNYQVELFQTKGSIIELENDFFFKAQYIEFYNPQYFTFYEAHNYQNIHSYANLEARPEFQAFSKQQEQLLFGNLCNQSGSYFVAFDGLNCSTVADGVLTNGFSQSQAVYSKLATQLKNITLGQFLTQPCQDQSCPMFTEQVYLNIKLTNLISNHIVSFRQFFTSLTQAQSSLNMQNLVISFGMIIILLVAFVVWIRLLAKRCRRSIKMFQVIPPYIMKKMKMTTYIRKNNILSNLSIL